MPQAESPEPAPHSFSTPQQSSLKKEASSPPTTIGPSTNGTFSTETTTSNSNNALKDKALLESEVQALTTLFSTVTAKAARTAVRANWRKCLTGDSHDMSFFARAVIKHGSDYVLKRVMAERGSQLLAVATPEFLDQAMKLRLESISAKELVALLAGARRLGYDEMDLVDEDEVVMPVGEAQEPVNGPTNGEMLIVREGDEPESQKRKREEFERREPPQPKEQLTREIAQYESAAYAQKLNSERLKQLRQESEFVCQECGSKFAQKGGLTYHTMNKVCLKEKEANPARYFCALCNRGFTNKGGYNYHIEHKVCIRDKEKTAAAAQASQASEQISRQLAAEQAAHQAAQPGPTSWTQSQSFHTASLPTSSHSTPIPIGIPAASATPNHQLDNFRPQYPSFALPDGSPAPRPQNSTPPRQPAPAAPIELTPAQIVEMNAKLAREEARFDEAIRNMPENLTAIERDEMMKKMKASSATRKSIIRREYGVQVRRSKVATANAIRTPDGGVDILVVDKEKGQVVPISTGPVLSRKSSGGSGEHAFINRTTATTARSDAPSEVPATTGFAPINRISSFRAAPAMSAQAVGPGAEPYRPAPPMDDGPDPKRRRTQDERAPGDNFPGPVFIAGHGQYPRDNYPNPINPNNAHQQQNGYAQRSPYPPQQGSPTLPPNGYQYQLQQHQQYHQHQQRPYDEQDRNRAPVAQLVSNSGPPTPVNGQFNHGQPPPPQYQPPGQHQSPYPPQFQQYQPQQQQQQEPPPPQHPQSIGPPQHHQQQEHIPRPPIHAPPPPPNLAPAPYVQKMQFGQPGRPVGTGGNYTKSVERPVAIARKVSQSSVQKPWEAKMYIPRPKISPTIPSNDPSAPRRQSSVGSGSGATMAEAVEILSSDDEKEKETVKSTAQMSTPVAPVPVKSTSRPASRAQSQVPSGQSTELLLSPTATAPETLKSPSPATAPDAAKPQSPVQTSEMPKLAEQQPTQLETVFSQAIARTEQTVTKAVEMPSDGDVVMVDAPTPASSVKVAVIEISTSTATKPEPAATVVAAEPEPSAPIAPGPEAATKPEAPNGTGDPNEKNGNESEDEAPPSRPTTRSSARQTSQSPVKTRRMSELGVARTSERLKSGIPAKAPTTRSSQRLAG